MSGGKDAPRPGGVTRVLVAVVAAAAVLGGIAWATTRGTGDEGAVSSRVVDAPATHDAEAAEDAPGAGGAPGPAEEPEPPEVLPVPAVGEPAAHLLRDGSPVLVVAAPDGGVSVLSALSPVPGWPFTPLVGWCASSQLLEERPSGSRFLPDGTWLAGPAEGGLARYPVELAEGGTVRITGPAEPQPRPDVQPEVTLPGPGCVDDPALPLAGHHAGMVGTPPESLRGVGEPAQVLVTGRLEANGGAVNLCSAGGEPGRQCGEEALALPGGWGADEDPDLLWAWSGEFVVTLEGGTPTSVQAAAGVAEHTGYISGQITHVGALRAEPPAAFDVIGHGDPELYLVGEVETEAVAFAVPAGVRIVAGPALARFALIPVQPEDLRTFVASGAGEGVRFTVVVDKPTAAIVEIREGG